MYLWIQIDPQDDWWIVAEGKCEGDCTEVKKEVLRVEAEMGLRAARRLIDPNMGASPSGQKRDITWQQEFTNAGLFCDLADDSGVGRQRLNQMFKPDPQTLKPRIAIHPRCRDTIYQLERYVWDNYSHQVDRDQKQTPKAKYDDFPSIMKYVANSDPSFNFLKMGAPIIHRKGTKRGSYG